VAASAAVDAGDNGVCMGDRREGSAGVTDGEDGVSISPDVVAECNGGCVLPGMVAAEGETDECASEERAFMRSSCLLILIPYSKD
jgi:hypothetical protein